MGPTHSKGSIACGPPHLVGPLPFREPMPPATEPLLRRIMSPIELPRPYCGLGRALLLGLDGHPSSIVAEESWNSSATIGKNPQFIAKSAHVTNELAISSATMKMEHHRYTKPSFLVTMVLYPHAESNRNRQNRNLKFYPLNYRGRMEGKYRQFYLTL